MCRRRGSTAPRRCGLSQLAPPRTSTIACICQRTSCLLARAHASRAAPRSAAVLSLPVQEYFQLLQSQLPALAFEPPRQYWDDRERVNA
jgi:hypothetical protein